MSCPTKPEITCGSKGVDNDKANISVTSTTSSFDNMRWSTSMDTDVLNTPVITYRSPYPEFPEIPEQPEGARVPEYVTGSNRVSKSRTKKRKAEVMDNEEIPNDFQLQNIRSSSPFRKLRKYEVRLRSSLKAFMNSKDSRTFSNIAANSTNSTTKKNEAMVLDKVEMFSLCVQKAMIADEDGDRPVHIAAVKEDVKLVQKLCLLMRSVGATVDFSNYLRQTPLHLGTIVGNVNVVQILLQYGASMSIQDRHGNTPLQLATKYFKNDVLQVLLSHPESKKVLNSMDYEGFSALHHAVLLKNFEAVNLLYKARADINITDGKSGRTPLAHAIAAGQEDMVSLLLECRACPDKADYAGYTPRDFALNSENWEIKKLFGESYILSSPSISVFSCQQLKEVENKSSTCFQRLKSQDRKSRKSEKLNRKEENGQLVLERTIKITC